MEVAIIVAGGSGSRMNADVPKQFLELAGMPILMHTIKVFRNYSNDLNIILVLPQDRLEDWENLKGQYKFIISHTVVIGGNSRTESVRNGLTLVENSDIVAIHDGVRPLITKDVISRAFQVADKHSNAIVSVQLKDSLRKLNKEKQSHAVERKDFRLVQTPQVFQGELIKNAYQKIKASDQEFTDDASVVEHFGYSINLVDGEYSNIKITTQEDLIVAESILKSRAIL